MSTPTRDPSYSIREAARLSGLPESTLRYYEAIGLMGPVGRDPSSKHRRYTEADIDHAVSVACLSAMGMSIEDMRAYLRRREGGRGAAPAQLELFESYKQRLEEEARNLELRRRYIDAKIAYWRAVEAGDLERARAVGEAARSVRDALRASKAQLTRPEAQGEGAAVSR
ncbi:MerR family transcriptional regulator [Truepera radiovictrix]|uniref:Transcriptional regulator, MerR family n=1 Tax=Truepera radiovictrix (strain DSM 17093 / CIP 108686 / LMG 22925 / RQ-24) TaxID=649638 RepID=D7CYA8_TRURR|nr:MerR family transcriptional regulator [Truepera radiovictrix]ADI14747.1 transcriptional regulator, MerR family [Truepera radiovictrix DSM 17093]WMT56703.1 MerR family transcriptional regulator [Truepera radiovictrix]